MNKAWDAALPARAIWAEVLRVLKPGASCFVCAGSRQDTILGLLTDLREVGFDIQHAALSWVYWSGFPKSSCVSKQCDKAAFLAWLREVPPGETETRQKLMDWDAADVRKAASAAVNGAYSATVPESRVGRQRGMAHFTGDQIRPYESETHATETHGTRLLSALQARFGDAPGVRASRGIAGRTGGGRTCMEGTVAGGRTQDTLEGEYNSTSPSTPDAIEWDGWHSSSVPLKPASEQILWVTKPAEPGPARGNVLKWGVGAVNVDGCRVPTDETLSGSSAACMTFDGDNSRPYQETYVAPGTTQHSAGRYPSNLLVTARALGDDSKYGDLDAWARERGLSDEWLDAALSAGVLRVPKPSRAEKNAGLERNTHATVKPTTLFAFLCTLACPRGGVVLDPFGGSGTTGVAAIQSGMHWVLIEREPEYCTIAEARTTHAKQQARRAHQPAMDLEVTAG